MIPERIYAIRKVLLLPFKDWGIHRQCFHQQIKVAAFVVEEFMWIVWEHKTKVKSIK